MLTVEVKLNGRYIAGFKATNISNLRDVSDYAVEVVEGASEVSGLPAYHESLQIRRHKRRSTVWHLVAKIAARALDSREHERGNLPPPEPIAADTPPDAKVAARLAKAMEPGATIRPPRPVRASANTATRA